MTNQKNKDNSRSKGKNNSKGKGNSRFPSGMTTRKANQQQKHSHGIARYLSDSMMVPPLAYIA
jgi:hypothetical protein